MTLKYLIQKEFLQIRRNSFMPKIIFIFPIMVMCVMPWVMNQEVKNIRVDVVDNDRSTLSQQLVHSIEASNYFIFNGLCPTYNAAFKDIETSKADIVLVIPRNYSHDLTLDSNPQILIAANAVNGTKGSIGLSYLSQIVNQSSPIKIESLSLSGSLSTGEGGGRGRYLTSLPIYLHPSTTPVSDTAAPPRSTIHERSRRSHSTSTIPGRRNL